MTASGERVADFGSSASSLVRRPFVRRGLVTVAEAFDPRANVISLLRLVLALMVTVGHSWPLGGFGSEPVGALSHDQVHLARLGVLGFFTLSGFLIVRSAAGCRPGRFLWHRAVRLLPAYWVCLLVTAFVLAPVAWAHAGHATGFSAADPGPAAYVRQNWTTGIGQYGIGGLFLDTPYGRATGVSVVNGSLWSLSYEVCCYVGVLVLVVLGALSTRRWLVPSVLGLLLLLLAVSYVRGDRYDVGTALTRTFDLPMLGVLELSQLLQLAFMFGVGALAAAFPSRFPLDGRIALLAVVALGGSFVLGGFAVVGLAAFAYILLWLAARRASRFTRVGSRFDVSYGVYLYAFPLQQALAGAGVADLGLMIFVAGSVVAALGAGFLSWHLVEKHALRWKNCATPWPRRGADQCLRT